MVALPADGLTGSNLKLKKTFITLDLGISALVDLILAFFIIDLIAIFHRLILVENFMQQVRH